MFVCHECSVVYRNESDGRYIPIKGARYWYCQGCILLRGFSTQKFTFIRKIV